MIMEEKPSYYSILPAKVRYDNSLKPMEKIMFSEISALSNVHGYCHAGNAYFADLYDKSKPTISVWINDLKRNNHIRIKYEHEGKQIVGRKIYPIMDNISESQEGYLEKSNGGYLEKSKNPISKNLKENTTRVNNTSNNNSSSETSENPYELYQQITDRNLTGLQQPKMMDFIKTDGTELVVSALKTAQYIAKQSNSKPSYNLFDRVMHEWESNGIKTVDQAREYEKKRLRDKQERINKNKQAYYGHQTIDRKIPESMKEQYDPEKDKLSDEDKASLKKELEEFYERGKEEQE